MKDPSIPQFVVDSEIQISLQIPQTDAQLENQGNTYNQAGFTYNQAGVMYGGVYQSNQDVAPLFSNDFATDVSIRLIISPTDAQFEDQGYVYNQSGFTYNQVGVIYGGLSQGNQDIAPLFFNDDVTLPNPSISSIIDMGLTGETESQGQLMGILGLTYPKGGILE